MALQVPTISGISPAANDTDVVLRPTIELVVGGQSLIDPLTWNSATFALYGPGDVVLESGPGTILNSGLDDAPYPLLDGPLRRDRCDGTYSLLISGTSGLDTAESAIGTAGQLMLARFTPSYPLLPNTTYTAVLVGDDSDVTSDLRFPGMTSFTSPSGFIQSGVLPGITSGYVEIVTPYSKTLQTNQYNSTTGQNDTYTITITSGHSVYGQPQYEKGFKYQWSKASSPGTYSAVVSGTTDRHNFGDGLQVDFVGTFASGEVHELNTYIPKPLALSLTWAFSTGEIESYATPPSDVDVISVVIDNTATGGLSIDTTVDDSERLYVVSTFPTNLDYAVYEGLPYIAFEFNKTLLSGFYDPTQVTVKTTPLLGIGVEPSAFADTTIDAAQLETSGKWLKVWL